MRHRLFARYPRFAPQPFTGNLLTMQEAGTSDILYSSGTAPHYQNPIDLRYGRPLAGQDNNDMKDKDNGWAKNELEVLAELDDVQGSGIFDPPGTHPNIWPDAGVFATSYSLPGYHARERMFAKSEVRDATTGRPIVPVPSGAVAIDNAAIIAMMERGKYRPPEQILRANAEYAVPFESTVNVAVNPLPLGDVQETPPPPPTAVDAPSNSAGKFLLAAALVGAAGASLYALMRKKHRPNRSRRRR